MIWTPALCKVWTYANGIIPKPIFRANNSLDSCLIPYKSYKIISFVWSGRIRHFLFCEYLVEVDAHITVNIIRNCLVEALVQNLHSYVKTILSDVWNSIVKVKIPFVFQSRDGGLVSSKNSVDQISEIAEHSKFDKNGNYGSKNGSERRLWINGELDRLGVRVKPF